jgi:hypothetical protein
MIRSWQIGDRGENMYMPPFSEISFSIYYTDSSQCQDDKMNSLLVSFG